MRRKTVHKYSIILLVILAAASAVIEPRKLPVSILIGGVLGLANFRGMTVGLDALLGTHKPALKLMFLNIFRLIIIMTTIIILAALRVVDLLGLLGGFTAVLAVIVAEGLRTARAISDDTDQGE